MKLEQDLKDYLLDENKNYKDIQVVYHELGNEIIIDNILLKLLNYKPTLIS